MHPRNPYRNTPDFRALARSYPPLSKHLQGGSIDFHDDAAQRCLTQALLKRDFNLETRLPPDRLCPPDTVAGLRDAAPYVLGRAVSGKMAVRGLDIGTGASAIYPLLACTCKPTWTFVATDNVRSNGLSDRIRLVKARASAPAPETDKTVNGDGELRFGFDQLFYGTGSKDEDGATGLGSHPLDAKISIQTDTVAHKEEPVPDGEPERVDEAVEIQFTMCNPPFYSSAEDVAQSEARKEQSAFGVCTGAPVEMITPGGEARFVGAMVRESVDGGIAKAVAGTSPVKQYPERENLKRRRVDGGSPEPAGSRTSLEATPPIRREARKKGPRWYTSMLGKMGSVVEIVYVLKELGITNYAITEFVQGHTRRWAVGWSMGAWRLDDNAARITNPNPTLLPLLPARNTLRFPIGGGGEGIEERLLGVLGSVEGATVTFLQECEGAASTGDGEDHATGRNEATPMRIECKLVVTATSDTWSRAARRKRKRSEALGNAINGDVPTTSTTSGENPDPALVCGFTILSGDKNMDVIMEVRWLYGWDRMVFESFASHVAKKVKLEGEDAGRGR
ncbi:hypothetical protein FPV67DRAFT_1444380 [Lyophyllum atratum]|nr:hypothetical protein FPV67DRAFT_1444380 [Lyophyllum atratum]